MKKEINKPYGSMKINGREVPLASNKLPNRKHLTKVEKEIVDQYIQEKNKQKKEILQKEITDLLKNL